MNNQCMIWLSLTYIIYLACTVSPVSGKCRGKWAIHACYGGNGKRSGTDMTVDSTDRNRKLFLRQLLLRGGEQIPDTSMDFDSNSPIVDSGADLYDTQDVDLYNRENDLIRMKSLLSALLFERKLREEEEALDESNFPY